MQGAGRLTACCDVDWLATALIRFQFETLDSVQEMGDLYLKDIENPNSDSFLK